MNTPQAHGTETAKPVAPAATPAHAPGRGSPLRLGILLLVLATCIGALVFDYQVAGPGAEAANIKIQSLVQARNQMSVKEAGPVTTKDIQKELGRGPTWVEEEPTHTIEWYCWWGKTPLLSTRRHFITVLYVGDSRRFSSQTLNGPPAEDELPTYVPTGHGDDEVGPLSPPSGAPPSGPPPGIPSMGSGMPAGMGGGMPPGAGGKGKGKGKGGPPIPGREPSTNPPPAAEPGDAPSNPEPTSEKPATDAAPSTDKPAPDKPDADKPAGDKAEKPASESGDNP